MSSLLLVVLMPPSCHARRKGSQTAEILPTPALELPQLGNRVLHVAQPLVEVRAPLVDLAQHVLQLRSSPPGGVEEVDDRADLLEREAEPLAPEDERQAGAVAPVVD